MKTLKIVSLMLSSMFLLNCGVDASRSEPTTSAVESDVTLRPCSQYDGRSCTVKGPIDCTIDGEPSTCDCVQSGASYPYHYNC